MIKDEKKKEWSMNEIGKKWILICIKREDKIGIILIVEDEEGNGWRIEIDRKEKIKRGKKKKIRKDSIGKRKIKKREGIRIEREDLGKNVDKVRMIEEEDFMECWKIEKGKKIEIGDKGLNRRIEEVIEKKMDWKELKKIERKKKWWIKELKKKKNEKDIGGIDKKIVWKKENIDKKIKDLIKRIGERSRDEKVGRIREEKKDMLGKIVNERKEEWS